MSDTVDERGIAIVDPTELDTADRILEYLGELDTVLGQTYDVADVLVIKDHLDAIRFLQNKLELDQAVKNRVAESQIKTQRRLGVLILQAPKNGGQILRGSTMEPRGNEPTYAEMGIAKTSAHRWQTLARVPEDRLDEFISEANERGFELTAGGAHAFAKKYVRKHHPPTMNETGEWIDPETGEIFGDDPPPGVAEYELYTPAWIVNRVRLALGGTIDLDPASCKEAQEVIRANRFYDLRIDGLTQEWDSPAVFVNPPYGRTHNEAWAEKIVREHVEGRARKVIALVPAATGVPWFQCFADFPRCFPNGRLPFWGPADQDLGARFDSALINLGVDIEVFGEAFEDVGTIYVRWTK